MSNNLKGRRLCVGPVVILISLYYSAPVSIASNGAGLTASDTVPPLISRVYAEDITSDSVVINWTTDEDSDTQVEYGISQIYGYASDMDSSMVTNHRQLLTGLLPFTQYHFRVWSQDDDGNLSVSEDHVFSTSVASDTPYVHTNQPPVISFLNFVPSSGAAPLSVIFWIGASDSDGEVVEYDWDFDGNGSIDAVTTSNQISFIYQHAGAYAATVRIFDDEGASTVSEPVTIRAVEIQVNREAVNDSLFLFRAERYAD